MSIWTVLLIAGFTFGFAALAFQFTTRRKTSHEADRVIDRSARDLVVRQQRAILGTPEWSAGPPPEPVAWTPLEREVNGFNDTNRWIEQTQRTLNSIAWEKIEADAQDYEILRDSKGNVVRKIWLADA